jgi:hypothetical protein
MLRQLHLYVCQTSDHNAQEKRTLLHRATDWMQTEKLAGDVRAGVCIVLTKALRPASVVTSKTAIAT